MVKGGQVGLSLRSVYQDRGIPMKIEIQSDSATANSLTDRLGAGQRTKHIDTRYFWIQERVQDGDLSIKKVRRSTATTLLLLNVDPTLHYKMKVTKSTMDLVKGCKPDVNTETRREARAQKQTVVSVDREHRDRCAS